jgi:gas vesicle protein
MGLTDRARENSDEALDKIKDVAETVGISVAVVASETWDKAKDLADSIGHKLTDLAEDVKDKVSGSDEDEAPTKNRA